MEEAMTREINYNITGARQIVGSVADKLWRRLTWRNPETGEAIGPVARAKDALFGAVFRRLARIRVRKARSSYRRLGFA